MAETIKLLKGLKANLPSSGATPGAMYCCTDTGGIYIANSNGVPQLIANIDTGATSTGSSGSGNAVTSLSYNTNTRKLTYNLGNSFLPLAGGNLTGHIYLTGAKSISSTGNTSQIVFGTQADNHIAISSNTNALVLNPSTSETTNQIVLYLDKSSSFPNGITGNLTGNASTATKFAAAQTVALTGDVTGSVSSQAGWSIATTLKNSGVSAGSYGPSANVSPEHGKTFSVPYFTVDAKGRVTAASTKTITLPGINDATISVAAGKGLTDGGSFTTNQGTAGTITLNVGAGTGISVTDNAVSLSTSGVSAGSYGPSANASPTHGGTFSVPYITADAYGRITAASTKTITLPTYSLSSFGITATAAELNYVDGVTSNIQTQLNSKLGDYTIEIYNGTGGNPKPVRFASFNYSTCGSENGIAAKISLVSGHGNGTSYAFLEDAIIRVNHQGAVSVDNFKYYGEATGTYDGANRQYGDIFWLHDTTNKIIDFYVLMGQYARVYQTPWKRLTYSTGGTVTQHTSCTVYSSGDKVWGNNSEIALMSDIPIIYDWAKAASKPTYTASEIGLTTETWEFTYEDGSTETKVVYVG